MKRECRSVLHARGLPGRFAYHGARAATLVALTTMCTAGCTAADSDDGSLESREVAVVEWDIGSAQFAFLTNRDGNGEVYLSAQPAAVPVNLTNDPSFDGFAAWSPDGASIVFDSDRAGNGNRDVYVRAMDGAELRRLTSDPGYDFSPQWSPDGQWITFSSTRDSEFDPVAGNVEAFRGEIYRIRPDGTDLQRLTNDPAHDQAPAWSADGRLIAWCRDDNGAGDIWVMAADGSDPRPLVTMQDFECSPAWSPDGEKLAWRATRGDSSWIVVAQANGSRPVRLPMFFPNNYEPGWSPDSRWICFTAVDADGGLDLYAMRVDAADTPILLAGGPDREQACAWRPRQRQ